MLHKTEGIVLNAINYNDKYLLVQIFTKSFGSVTYMVPKSKSKKTKVSKLLFTPLAILEMEVDHQSSRDIQRIREVQPLAYLHNIAMDMNKISMAFFLSEFFARVLKDTDNISFLFDFIHHSILILDNADNSIANFHLVFILKLSRFLGFYPNLEEYSNNDIFDMMNGEFVQHQPLHNYFVSKHESLALSRLARINFENMHKFRFTREERLLIINKMIEYYQLHLHEFPHLKSLDVLHELF